MNLTKHVLTAYPNWPENIDYNSKIGWETEKQIVLAQLMAEHGKSKGIKYSLKDAEIELSNIAKQLDLIELKYFFSDAHAHDVTTNKSNAFYALQKAKEAFIELSFKF